MREQTLVVLLLIGWPIMGLVGFFYRLWRAGSVDNLIRAFTKAQVEEFQDDMIVDAHAMFTPSGFNAEVERRLPRQSWDRKLRIANLIFLHLLIGYFWLIGALVDLCEVAENRRAASRSR